MNDAELLARYATTGSQDAFADVVQRCLPLVYAAALRRVGGDVHQAEDVAQGVFTALARNARALSQHPDLTGWLFTTTRFLAAKTMRGERRRQRREQKASIDEGLMNSDPSSPADAPLNAVLDDAMMELRQLDRQIILLRFHRGLRLAEIGAHVGATENAVQKRLDRALDQLKDRLARRGITSTAAALAVAFEQQSVIAVPAGLAAAATTAGLASGAGSGGLAALAGLMTITKLQLGVAAGVVAVTATGLVWQARENAALRAESAVAVAAATTRAGEAKTQLAAVSQRAEAAEEQVSTLRKTIGASPARPAAAPGSRVLIDMRNQAMAALNQASRLAQDGKPEEALREFLRLYRELEGTRDAIDQQLVMSSIKSLGRTYQPALTALRDLRDGAMQKLQTKPGDRDTLTEIALLNERLEEGRATMALYDSLPSDDRSRQAIALTAHTSLVEARRYSDALVGKSFGSMLRELDLGLRIHERMKGGSETNHRAFVVSGTLTNIEVLTGVGKLDDARVLTEKLLAFDNSEATRAAIQRHVQRATQPAP